jgi:hypothetical protein
MIPAAVETGSTETDFSRSETGSRSDSSREKICPRAGGHLRKSAGGRLLRQSVVGQLRQSAVGHLRKSAVGQLCQSDGGHLRQRAVGQLRQSVGGHRLRQSAGDRLLHCLAVTTASSAVPFNGSLGRFSRFDDTGGPMILAVR